MKTIREHLNQLDEISRRGFLKGISAAGLAGAASVASGQTDQDAEQARRDNLRRMAAMAGATGPEQQPVRPANKGPSSTYAQRIRRAIYPNITFTGSVDEISNPAEVEIRSNPDGEIIGYRLTRSSGNKDWDLAAVRAVKKTDFLPKDIDGNVPPVILMNFRP